MEGGNVLEVFALNELPFVSIIILCRDEVKSIDGCLNSIFSNDYPKESLEVLAVDGMSEDGARDVITSYAQQHP